ncbi:PEP-utilizing enzyme [Lacrimispora sp.]|uniref:PEP-utilizing enzyme n=1 Tax=Lacrimispora sp. TaxID=2719234 RepID=UPI002FDA2CC2
MLCTSELFPSEIAEMGKARLKAVVTSRCSSCSHMVILAKSLGIPAIVGVGHFPENIGGKRGTADTGAGKLFIGQV